MTRVVCHFFEAGGQGSKPWNLRATCAHKYISFFLPLSLPPLFLSNCFQISYVTSQHLLAAKMLFNVSLSGPPVPLYTTSTTHIHMVNTNTRNTFRFQLDIPPQLNFTMKNFRKLISSKFAYNLHLFQLISYYSKCRFENQQGCSSRRSYE
jgi:hypothetical protein